MDSPLEQKPDLHEWRTLSTETFWTATGGGSYRGRAKHIEELKKLSDSSIPTESGVSLLIKSSAQAILQTKTHLNEMKKMMRESTARNPAVRILQQIRGISVIASSTLAAEIIDIRQFANDDHLAFYTGLGRNEYSSGEKSKMIQNLQLTHRLKDIFMTAAKNFVLHNADAHLSEYFRNLVNKKGMKANEACKRVARAPVRMVFRLLRALIEEGSEDQKRSESDMASGSNLRDDISHESNISLPAPIEDDIEEKRKIKNEE